MKTAAQQLRFCVLLCCFALLVGSFAAQSREYPVEHLPMLEKFNCYVLFHGNAGIEDVLPYFVASLEKDARLYEKEKKVVLVSPSVTDGLFNRIRQEEGGLQRVALQREHLTPEVITQMTQGEGARFLFINTCHSEQLPPELISHIKEVSKGKLDVAKLSSESAGYQVYWQWKQRRKKNQMWVIVYAPGTWTMRNILSRSLTAVAHRGGDNTREPSESVPVSRWTFRIDTELTKNKDFNLWLQKYILEQSLKREQWIEPSFVSMDASAAQGSSTQIPDGNSASFVLHKNISSIEAITALPVEDLKRLQPNHLAILTNDQPSQYVYVAANPALLQRLILEHPPFENPLPRRIEVPELGWIKRVAVVFTRNATQILPEGARSRIVQELKAGLPFWQVYDETLIEKILRLEEIGIRGLPGGASPSRSSPVDAMLVIDISRYLMREPTWKQIGAVQRQPINLPFSRFEPSPRGLEANEWLARHVAWFENKEQFKQVLQRNEFEAQAEWVCIEEVDAEISCSLIDMRPASERYGTPVHPELVLTAASHQATYTRTTATRRGRFKYLLVEGTPNTIMQTLLEALSGSDLSDEEKEKRQKQTGADIARILLDAKPGVYHGRLYSQLILEVIPMPVQWEALPQYDPNPNSPVVSELSANLARSMRAWLETRALFDSTQKAPPPFPPDYIGKVSKVDGSRIHVQVDGLILPNPSEWIEVRCQGGSLPKAQVLSVSGSTLEARLKTPATCIQVGDSVYQTAPPPSPREIRVQNEVVITIALTKQPTSAQVESLKQRALRDAANKQAQAVWNEHKVTVDSRDLLKIAVVKSHQWNARTKQYVVRVLFSGTVREPEGGN